MSSVHLSKRKEMINPSYYRISKQKIRNSFGVKTSVLQKVVVKKLEGSPKLLIEKLKL